MKRQWGYDHIMTKKTMKHASADVGLIFIAYNLKRLFKIVGIGHLKQVLSLVLSRIKAFFLNLGTYRANITSFRAQIVFWPCPNLIQPNPYLFIYEPQ